MSVQLCISTVALKQQSSQKLYEGFDKSHPFLFHYWRISPAAIHRPVPSVPPPFSSSILWGAEIAGLAPTLPKDWVKPSRGSTIAVNFMWQAGTVVSATEQDLTIDGVIVLQCFSASCFSLPHSFLLALLPPPF